MHDRATDCKFSSNRDTNFQYPLVALELITLVKNFVERRVEFLPWCHLHFGHVRFTDGLVRHSGPIVTGRD